MMWTRLCGGMIRATGSSTLVYNTTRRRAMDSRSECHASVRKDVDSEEHHSAVEVDLQIAKERMKMQGNGYQVALPSQLLREWVKSSIPVLLLIQQRSSAQV
ncbi:hypothetical protein BHM03_00037789, partial [Ensete ventricosum]